MNTFKRILAMSLALLLSLSPMLSVSAADTETSSGTLPEITPDTFAYDSLMLTAEQIAFDDFTDPTNTLAVLSKSAIANGSIIRRTDVATNNTYIKMEKPEINDLLNFYHYSPVALDRVVFEVDIRWDNPGINVDILERKTYTTFMHFQNGVFTFEGSNKTATISSGQWHTLTVIMDFTYQTMDVFVDKDQILNRSKLPNGIANDMTGIRLAVKELSDAGSLNPQESSNRDLMFDNLKFYKQAPIEPSAYEKIMMDWELVASDDFSNASSKLTSIKAPDVILREVDDTGNTFLKFYQAGTSGHFVNLYHKTSKNDGKLVFEVDVRWDNPGTRIAFYNLPDKKTLMSAQNGTFTFNSPDGNTVTTIDAGEWYKITYAIDFEAGTYNGFVNEELVASNKKIPNSVTSLEGVRLQSANLNTQLADGTVSEHKDFLADNLNWYLPTGTIGGHVGPTTISPNGDGIFTKDEKVLEWISTQNNLTAISPYEGKYFAGGEKKVSTNAFICRNGEYLVPIDVFQQVFGTIADVDNNVLTVGQAVFVLDEKKIRIAGEEIAIPEAACVVDGVTYIPFFAYAEHATKKFVSESEYGDVILTDSALTLTEDQRFEVDLFLTKTRLTASELQNLYTDNGSANSHPRIWKDAEGFAELKTLTEADKLAGEWYAALKRQADELLYSGVISPGEDSYNFSTNTDHSKQLDAIRNLGDEVRLLGLIYNMTGETQYADVLKQKLMYVIDNNPSWYDGNNEIHYLRHGQLADAMGLGYDWLYNYLTPEERTKIAQYAYEGVLIPIREAYYGGGYWWTTTKLNWNTVISGGVTMLSLALADEYPELAFDAIEKALRSGEYSLSTWAPDGGWYEGNSYARYTAKYLQCEFSALQSTMGTMLDREKARGLSDASFYMYYIDSMSGGSVNFGDSDTAHAKVLGYYWASLYQSEEMAYLLEKWHNLLGTDFGTIEDFLYYDPTLREHAENVELQLDKYFLGEKSQMVVTREGWESADQMFASWAGGHVSQSHDHADAGSFVYDVNGYRFICDLGAKNYTFSGEDWDYFRKRAEAHNVMVINPDESHTPGLLGQKKPGQDIDGHAKLLYLNSGSGGVVSAIDLQDMYKKQTSSYIRGFMTMDNRRSLVVRDEIVLKEENSKLYWNLMTIGGVTLVDENTVIISRGGEAVKVEIITNADSFKLYRTDAVPYEFSPHPTDGQTQDGQYSRIMVEMVASGEFYIAAKISPMGEGINPAVPTSAISDWAPAGATEKAQIDTSGNVLTSITVDGREIFEDGVTNYQALLIGEDAEMPVINAIAAAGRNVQIINATNPGEATAIIVSDPANPESCKVYSVRYNVLPSYENIDNRVRYPIVNFEVSEETDERFLGIGMCDADMMSKWLSEKLGAYAIQELAEAQEIHAFALAFDYSNKRTYSFEIFVSEDGINYKSVLKETAPMTAENGTIATYVLENPVTAKFVKFVSLGNSANNKGNLIELAILGNSTICGDINMDHICDDRCGKTYGIHEDANKDHICDYGCKKTFGECVDENKDHKCDYGCQKFKGACTDFDKDHACDYGCNKFRGKCEDADSDGVCDYGCDKTFVGDSNSAPGDAEPATGIWEQIVRLFTIIADFFKNLFSNLF